MFKKPSRFGSVRPRPDLEGEVSGLSPGQAKDFKNGKGNALYSEHPDKGGII